MNTESWLPVPGYEGLYEVSDLGRVKSLPRTTTRGRILRPGVKPDGRPFVCLCKDGKPRAQQLHKLVLLAFVGPRPEGTECCHWNGDATDNRLVNLRWDTPEANQRDKDRHGTHVKGEEHWRSKIVGTDVERIRDLRRAGIYQREIAAWVGLTQASVWRILERKSWAHIP